MGATSQNSDTKLRLTLSIGEALSILLPFIALQISLGYETGTLVFESGQPRLAMPAGFWIPAFLLGISYGYLLTNIVGWRKGTWRWYAEGLASVLIIAILGAVLFPTYSSALGRSQRAKLHIHHYP